MTEIVRRSVDYRGIHIELNNVEELEKEVKEIGFSNSVTNFVA